MKDHAEYTTEAEIRANVARIAERRKKGIRSPEEEERDAYFTDPANAEEIAATFARIELVKAMHKARKEAGLTQKEMARKLRKKQSYISAVENGRKNITFATLARYAHACGKKIALL